MKKHPTRWYSHRQEKSVAKVVDGKQTANSGATTFQKGDVVTDNWLIECKTMTEERKSFTVKREWLTKNKEEAFSMGKEYNALVFDFGDNGQRYYIIDERTFKLLKEVCDEER